MQLRCGLSWLVRFMVLASAILHAAIGIEIDNSIIEEPEVECGANTVEMQFRTAKIFRGKVFVKGHFTNPDCRVDYSNRFGGSTASARPTGGIVIQHGTCDMDRQRMISPQGMQFSSVVVVSFHPTFITKVDRAFHIKCMYRELSKTVTSGMEVSMLTTQTLDREYPMPTCTYTIRRDQLDGEILRYARVGEMVVHRWECQSDVYGILVHSCQVEDGQGEKVEVVDSRGCHIDRYLLDDLTYVNDLTMAYREAHVFKFADRVAVRFQCQIRLCMKENNGCLGITPPDCRDSVRRLAPFTLRKNDTTVDPSYQTVQDSVEVDEERSTADAPRLRFRRGASSRQLTTAAPALGVIEGDLLSQYIYVLDSAEEPARAGKSKQDRALSSFLERANGAIVSEMRNGGVCLSSVTFGLLLGSVTVVFLAAACVAVSLCCQRSRSKTLDFDQSTTSPSSEHKGSCYSSVAALWTR